MLLSIASADVYMQSPRGANGRNAERNVNRNSRFKSLSLLNLLGQLPNLINHVLTEYCFLFDSLIVIFVL